MAIIGEISPEQQAWIDQRPPSIKALIERFPPNRLYRLKDTGSRCTIYSYSENDTMTVVIDGTWGLEPFPRRVFGIEPDSIEECDLPPDDEQRGLFLNDGETEQYVNMVRGLNGLEPISLNGGTEHGR